MQKIVGSQEAPVDESVKRCSADQAVQGSRPAGRGVVDNRKRGSIAYNLSLSPFHRPYITDILLKKNVKYCKSPITAGSNPTSAEK